MAAAVRLTVAYCLVLLSSHHAAAWSSPAASGAQVCARTAPRLAVLQMQVNKDGYLEKGPLQWIPPNMGGERVVRKKKKEGSADTLGKKTIARRTLVAGALLPGALYANLVQSENERKEKARNVPLDDGDAATTDVKK